MFDFIDKLKYYPDKVKVVFSDTIGYSLSTVFLDLSTNVCDFNCFFCDAKFYKLPQSSFSRDKLLEIIEELKELKVDSVLICGEGSEPLLHPNFKEISEKLIDSGFYVGIYTNGSIIHDEIINVLSRFDFVRISLNASTLQMHKKIHCYTRSDIFDTVEKFIFEISKVNENTGVSFLLLEENICEMFTATELSKKLGAKYIQFKPAYLKNYNINKTLYANKTYIFEQIQKSQSIEDDNFKVLLNNQLRNFPENVSEITYQATPIVCLTSRFRMVISPTGCYLCTPHRSKDQYRIGDPNKQSIKEIWFSDLHSEILQKKCNYKCAYFAQNKYLLDLKNSNIPFQSTVDNSRNPKSFL